MSIKLGPVFGNGADGHLSVSGTQGLGVGNTTCTGTAGSKTLSVGSVANFSDGDRILLHQSKAGTPGSWKLNQVTNVGSGQLTLQYDLINSYVAGAQAIVVPQYTGVTINAGGILTPSDWNESSGGILAFCCSGKLLVTGTINGNGKGFQGGNANSQAPTSRGWQGYGEDGTAPDRLTAQNSSGGGGGQHGGGGGGGGGGGHVASGSNGSGAAPGTGGDSAGSADLTDAVFGGGGGGGVTSGSGTGFSKPGGDGGGFIVIYAAEIEVTGAVTCNGNNADNVSVDVSEGIAGAGGGAGGSILIMSSKAVLGSNLVTATGGTGGLGDVGIHNSTTSQGGTGADGRIRVQFCSVTGTTDPAASEAGSQDFCGSVAQIIG